MVYGWLQEFFPESCPACAGATRRGFCATCAAEFAIVADACRRCGLPRPVGQCPALTIPWRLATLVAPLTYSAPLDHYVRALKYQRARPLARALALLIAPRLPLAGGGVDALVPVPLHPTRLRSRGYNQAAELARALARELDLPMIERGISRSSANASQTTQGARERRSSVARAFNVTRNLRGHRIAIVDDVVTTGATVNALAAELMAAGADRCVAWAVARTPERTPQPLNV